VPRLQRMECHGWNDGESGARGHDCIKSAAAARRVPFIAAGRDAKTIQALMSDLDARYPRLRARADRVGEHRPVAADHQRLHQRDAQRRHHVRQVPRRLARQHGRDTHFSSIVAGGGPVVASAGVFKLPTPRIAVRRICSPTLPPRCAEANEQRQREELAPSPLRLRSWHPQAQQPSGRGRAPARRHRGGSRCLAGRGDGWNGR